MERESEMNVFKSQLIRNALQKQPRLSLDIMTGMPRKAALDKLVQDIKNSSRFADFALFLVDINDLKALNSALGHEGADRVIADVGDVLKAHVVEAKAPREYGQRKKFDGLLNAWCFRFEREFAHTYTRRHTHHTQAGRRRVRAHSADDIQGGAI